MSSARAHVIVALLAPLLLTGGCGRGEGKAARERAGGMVLSSSAFLDGQGIPAKHTADGEDVSPGLKIEGVPGGSRSLALVVYDRDAPAGIWIHWIVWNIPAGTRDIPEGVEPEGVRGMNGWGESGYRGPDPPAGTHSYSFTLYALDTMLVLPEGSAAGELEKAMAGHILGKAVLSGKYSR